MASALPNPVDCCQTECDNIVENIPGPQGPAGADGVDGEDGENAYTTLTAGFTQPPVDSDVTASVESSAWATPTQVVYVESAGYMRVQSKPSATQLTLRNLGYTGNAAPSTSIATGSSVSPAGLKGEDGAGGADDFDDLSPATSKGQLVVFDGTNSVAVSPGANGTVLKAASGETAGLAWEKIDLSDSAEVENALPVANGGTGATDAATAATNLAVVKLAGSTMTGDLRISKVGGALWIENLANALDEKKWRIAMNGSSLRIEAVNDAENVFNSAASLTRIGVVPSAWTVPALFVTGDARIGERLFFTRSNDTTLVDGDNDDAVLNTATYRKLKAGPTAGFALTGIADGSDGDLLILQNGTGQVGTLKHQNAGSIATNRIVTDTGADATFTFAMLLYDSEDSLWYVVQRW